MSYASTVLGDRPMGYWQLQETSGTTAPDLSGHGFDGTYSGTYTQHSGASFGTQNSVDFNGGKVSIPDATPLHITGDMTIESWFKVPDLTGFKSLFTKATSNQAASWDSYIDSNNVAFIRGNGSASVRVEDAPPGQVQIGTWYHLVMTQTGTAVRYYFNSTITASSPVTLSTTQADTGKPVLIANRDDNLGGHIAMAHVAVYNYALTQAQVSNHYNAVGNSDPSDAGLSFGPVALGTSPADFYVVPAIALAEVRELRIVNTQASPVTVNVSWGADAVSTRWLSGYQIPANDAYEWSGMHLIAGGTRLQASCSVANACDIYINGILQI